MCSAVTWTKVVTEIQSLYNWFDPNACQTIYALKFLNLCYNESLTSESFYQDGQVIVLNFNIYLLKWV